MSLNKVLLFISAIFLASCGSASTETANSDESSSAVDPGVAASSDTWQEYRDLVSWREALGCLVAERSPWSPDESDPLTLPAQLTERAFTIYEEVFNQPPSLVIEAFDGFEQMAVVSDVEIWLDARVALAHLGVEGNWPNELDDEQRRHSLELVQDLDAVADSVGPTGEVDIGPVFAPQGGVFFPGWPPSCPFRGTGALWAGMDNFGTDDEGFGGRGHAARNRCADSAMVDLMLGEFIAAESPSGLVEPTTAAFSLLALDWSDRTPDPESVAVEEAWVRLVDEIDGEPTAEQIDAAEDILKQWRAYRDTLPEGFILCPLDIGWTA